MAQHSEHKRFLKSNEGFSNRDIEPTTEHSGEDSNKEVHDLNTTRHARERLKTKDETVKSKKHDTQMRERRWETSDHEEPVQAGYCFPPFLICDSHIARLSSSDFLSKPFSSLFSQLTPLYSSFSHFSSLPGVIDG